MLPNERFALDCRAYYDEIGLVVDRRNGQFAHSPLTRHECDTGYYLLWGHHQHQGLLQSRDLGKCCFFPGHVKKWLAECDYFPDNYFLLWDIYEEFATAHGKKSQELGLGIHGITEEERIANREKGGRKAHELGVGVHGMTREEKIAAGLKSYELGVGIHRMTQEERVAAGVKSLELGLGVHGMTQEEKVAAGEKAYELGVGLHGMSKEERVAASRKGGRKAKELGVGAHGMTKEQLSRRNKKSAAHRKVQLKVTDSEGVVNTFGSIGEAAKEFNCSEGCVRNRLAARKPTTSGKLKGLLFEKIDKESLMAIIINQHEYNKEVAQ